MLCKPLKSCDCSLGRGTRPDMPKQGLQNLSIDLNVNHVGWMVGGPEVVSGLEDSPKLLFCSAFCWLKWHFSRKNMLIILSVFLVFRQIVKRS